MAYYLFSLIVYLLLLLPCLFKVRPLVLSKTLSQMWDRNIKESIYIRVNNSTLNNNIGKFNLSQIWDRVLLNTKGLTLNKQGNNNNN